MTAAYRYMREPANRDEVMAEAGELKTPLPAAERFIDLQYLKAAGLQ